MSQLRWWLRLVGLFYVLQFILNTFALAPIRALGPPDVIDRIAANEPLARFLVDSWVIASLEIGAIGVVAVIASRAAREAIWLAWTLVAIELSRGIIADVYSVLRGNSAMVSAVWIVIHSVVIVTGLWAIRAAQREAPPPQPTA